MPTTAQLVAFGLTSLILIAVPGPSVLFVISRIVRDGFVVGVTNPKGIIFFAAVLPQFVDRSAGHIPLQLLLLGCVFVAIALVSDTVWALAAGAARSWLARSPRRLELIGGAGGLAMIGLGARLAVSGRHD